MPIRPQSRDLLVDFFPGVARQMCVPQFNSFQQFNFLKDFEINVKVDFDIFVHLSLFL